MLAEMLRLRFFAVHESRASLKELCSMRRFSSAWKLCAGRTVGDVINEKAAFHERMRELKERHNKAPPSSARIDEISAQLKLLVEERRILLDVVSNCENDTLTAWASFIREEAAKGLSETERSYCAAMLEPAISFSREQ